MFIQLRMHTPMLAEGYHSQTEVRENRGGRRGSDVEGRERSGIVEKQQIYEEMEV